MCVLVCVRVFICVLCVVHEHPHASAYIFSLPHTHSLSHTCTRTKHQLPLPWRLCFFWREFHLESQPKETKKWILFNCLIKCHAPVRARVLCDYVEFSTLKKERMNERQSSFLGIVWLSRVLYPKERKNERTRVQFLGFCVIKSGSLPQRKKVSKKTSLFKKMYHPLHTCEWCIHVCDMSYSCVTWLIHMCDMTHSYVWHDSFICVTWLSHMCAITHLYVQLDAFMRHGPSICATILIHTCDMTHWGNHNL